jgi:hypothetical protein
VFTIITALLGRIVGMRTWWNLSSSTMLSRFFGRESFGGYQDGIDDRDVLFVSGMCRARMTSATTTATGTGVVADLSR